MSEKEIQQILILFCDTDENIFNVVQEKIIQNINLFLPHLIRLQLNNNIIIAKRASNTINVYNYNNLFENFKKAFLKNDFYNLIIAYEKLFNINCNEFILKNFLDNFIAEIKSEINKNSFANPSENFIFAFVNIVNKYFDYYSANEKKIIEKEAANKTKSNFYNFSNNQFKKSKFPNPFSINESIEKKLISDNVFILLFFFVAAELNFKQNDFALAINYEYPNNFLLLIKINNSQKNLFTKYNSLLSEIPPDTKIQEMKKIRMAAFENISENAKLCNVKKIINNEINYLNNLNNNNAYLHFYIDENFNSFNDFFACDIFDARFNYEKDNNFFDEKSIIYKYYQKIINFTANIEEYKKI